MQDGNPIPELDPVTVEFLTGKFQDSIKILQDTLGVRIQELESNIESLEKQVATLIVGYGEQAVFMEALVAQLAFATEDQRKTFNDDLSNARKEMLKVMSDASKDLLARDNQGVASAVADLAEQQSPSSN